MILTAAQLKAKPIIDYPEYFITNAGVIIRNNNIKYAELDKDRYLRVQLWKGSKPKWFRVNRLVAEHYIVFRRLDSWEDVHHLDNDRMNNFYKNLKVMHRYEHMAEFHGWQKIDDYEI